MYIESVSSIKYYVVGDAGCGTLTRSSENVKAITGTPQGSSPLAAKGYRFVGWFEDVDCTVPTDAALTEPETQKLVPTKESGTIWGETVEFFAKFVPNETKLTVTNMGWDPFDTEQTFVFRLKGVENTVTEGIDVTFIIEGNGKAVIAALPVGQYSVAEIAGWSWRYDAQELKKTVTLSVDAEENVVTFTNIRSREKWLDGNSYIKNMLHGQ